MQWLKNGTQIGDLTILRQIARGGMGEVYEAHERMLDRRVALKIVLPGAMDDTLKQELVKRFLNEARTHAKVNHPNIATIYGIYADTEVPFITMEFIEGISIKEYLKHESLPASLALEIFSEIVDGVRAMSRAGVLHRDLKPANVVIRPDAHIKIVDFGIAKDSESEHTHVGVIVGSLPYLAPELRGGAGADWQSECWSLGAMLFEIAMRRRLVKDAQSHDLPLAPEDKAILGTRLSQMIEKMVASDRSERYPSPEALLSDVHRLRSQIGSPTPEDRLKVQNKVSELYQQALAKADQDSRVAKSGSHRSRRSLSSAARDVVSPSPTATKSFAQAIVANTRQRLGQRRANDWLFAAVFVAAVLITGLFLFNRSSDSIATQHQPRQEFGAEDTTGLDSTYLHGLRFDTVQGLQHFIQDRNPISFSWNQDFPAQRFQLDISDSPTFKHVLIRENLQGRHLQISEPLPEGKYFWRLFQRSSTIQPVGLRTGWFNLLSPQPIQLEQTTKNHLTETRAARVDLRWRCKFGVEAYRVEVANDPSFRQIIQAHDSPSCTGHLFEVPVGTWYWRVRSPKEMLGETFVSSTGSFEVLRKKIALSPPEAPQILNLNEALVLRKTKSRNPASPSKVEGVAILRWAGSQDVTSYQVQISRSSNMAPPVESRSVRAPELKWSVRSPGTVYWRVRAVASDGSESPFSGPGQVTVQLPEPQLPTEADLNLGSNGVFFRWPSVNGASHYKLRFQKGKIDNLEPGTLKEVLVAKPAYRFEVPGDFVVHVAAASAAGELLSEFSDPSEVRVLPPKQKPQPRDPPPVQKVVTIPKKTSPQLITPRNGITAHSRNGRVSILFKWSVVAVDSYSLEIANDLNFSRVLKYSTPENAMLVEKIPHTGRIYWRVCPIDLDKFACSEVWFIEAP